MKTNIPSIFRENILKVLETTHTDEELKKKLGDLVLEDMEKQLLVSSKYPKTVVFKQ